MDAGEDNYHSVAALRAAAARRRGRRGRRLGRTHERAGDFTLDLTRHLVDVEAGLGEKLPGVLDGVNPPRLDIDFVETGLGEQLLVLVFVQRTGDAADPQLHALAHRLRHLAADDDVGDGEAAAGLEHTEGLAKNPALVG